MRGNRSTFGPLATSAADEFRADDSPSLPDLHNSLLAPGDIRPAFDISAAFSDGSDLEERLAQLQLELDGSSMAREINFEVQMEDGVDEDIDDRSSKGSNQYVGLDPVVESPTPLPPQSDSHASTIPDVNGSPASEFHLPLRLHCTASQASALTVASNCSTEFSAFLYHSPSPLPRYGHLDLGRVGPIEAKVNTKADVSPRASSYLSVYRSSSSASQYSGAVRPETAVSSYSRPGSRQDALGPSRAMNAVQEEHFEDPKSRQSSCKHSTSHWSLVRKVGAVYGKSSMGSMAAK